MEWVNVYAWVTTNVPPWRCGVTALAVQQNRLTLVVVSDAAESSRPGSLPTWHRLGLSRASSSPSEASQVVFQFRTSWVRQQQ